MLRGILGVLSHIEFHIDAFSFRSDANRLREEPNRHMNVQPKHKDVMYRFSHSEASEKNNPPRYGPDTTAAQSHLFLLKSMQA